MDCRQAAITVSGKGDRHGFTLIEVLIAIAIFSIGILAVGAMQISSTNSNVGARVQTEAYTWVVDQIERLAALDYDNDDLDPAPDGHSVVRGPYTISWTVEENMPVGGAKRIAVTADGSHHQARPITIEFIKAR